MNTNESAPEGAAAELPALTVAQVKRCETLVMTPPMSRNALAQRAMREGFAAGRAARTEATKAEQVATLLDALRDWEMDESSTVRKLRIAAIRALAAQQPVNLCDCEYGTASKYHAITCRSRVEMPAQQPASTETAEPVAMTDPKGSCGCGIGLCTHRTDGSCRIERVRHVSTPATREAPADDAVLREAALLIDSLSGESCWSQAVVKNADRLAKALRAIAERQRTTPETPTPAKAVDVCPDHDCACEEVANKWRCATCPLNARAEPQAAGDRNG